LLTDLVRILQDIKQVVPTTPQAVPLGP
jgi:hypothetical protein